MNMKDKSTDATLVNTTGTNSNMIPAALQITRPPLRQRPSATIRTIKDSVYAAKILWVTRLPTSSTEVIGGKYAAHKNDNR